MLNSYANFSQLHEKIKEERNQKLLWTAQVWNWFHLPSCFLSAPMPKLLFVVGRFHPRQLLHSDSGSELQLHSESSSNRSESSKLNRSHSSAFHSGWTTSCAGSATTAAAAAAATATAAAAGGWFGKLFGCCCCEVIPVSNQCKMGKNPPLNLRATTTSPKHVNLMCVYACVIWLSLLYILLVGYLMLLLLLLLLLLWLFSHSLQLYTGLYWIYLFIYLFCRFSGFHFTFTDFNA